MATRESTIQSNILRYINEQESCKAINMPAPAIESGTPDVFACENGESVFIEVKNKDGSLDSVQAVKINEWVEASAQVIIVNSMDDFQTSWFKKDNNEIIFSQRVYDDFNYKIRKQGYSVSDYFPQKDIYIIK